MYSGVGAGANVRDLAELLGDGAVPLNRNGHRKAVAIVTVTEKLLQS